MAELVEQQVMLVMAAQEEILVMAAQVDMPEPTTPALLIILAVVLAELGIPLAQLVVPGTEHLVLPKMVVRMELLVPVPMVGARGVVMVVQAVIYTKVCAAAAAYRLSLYIPQLVELPVTPVLIMVVALVVLAGAGAALELISIMAVAVAVVAVLPVMLVILGVLVTQALLATPAMLAPQVLPLVYL